MTELTDFHSSDDVTPCDTGTSKFWYDDRPCGSGKTHAELTHMVSTPGRYLFACDRKASITERVAMIARLKSEFHSNVVVVTVMSGDPDERQKVAAIRQVRVQVEALPGTYTSGHVIVLITHVGLMDSDLTKFQGWALIIDETPSIFETHTVNSQLSWPILERHFDLAPGDPFNVMLSKSAINNAVFYRDDMTRPIATLQRRVESEQYEVLTALDAWAGLEANPKWRWVSIWTPRSLRAFDRVTILANAFDRSLTYKVMEALEPEIVWNRLVRTSRRVFNSRLIKITYFAEAHLATRGLFSKPKGQANLSAVANFLAAAEKSSTAIWSCNKADRQQLTRMPGEHLAPRQAGSNAYDHIDVAAMIYAAKPSPPEVEVLEALGVDAAAVRATREFEVIYQFVSRTSVRDPESARPVRLYVYDHVQARYLEEMLEAMGYDQVQTVSHDLGFLHDAHENSPGRKTKSLQPEEIVAKKLRERELSRERKRKSRAKAK